MAVIEITDKNIKEHTKKCVVLKMHRHAGVNLSPGDIVIKEGEFLYDAINRGLIRLYDPALDDPKEDPVPLTKAESDEIIANMEVDPVPINNEQLTINNEAIELKKLGPKKRKSKKE